MGFQRARTEEQIAGRQEEIISACDTLYLEKGYEAVHFKAISQITSISRPSIYNYYKTKEDIFLDVLKRDYIRWEKELKTHYAKINKMTKNEFCNFIIKSLIKHEKYLELITIYLHPIEINSSLEKLTSFKTQIYNFFGTIHYGLHKYFPRFTAQKRQKILFYFMAMVTGAYSHTHLTEKQIKAMKNADPDDVIPDFRQVCRDGLMMLLRDG